MKFSDFTKNFLIIHKNSDLDPAKIFWDSLKKDRFIISLIDHVRSSQSDDFILNLDGNFIESQAFAYLAARAYLKLPISFPETTGCLKACTGGEIIKF